MKLDLRTSWHREGKITQEVLALDEGHVKSLSKLVIDTKEKEVHKALVSLGWTPPHKSPTKKQRFWVKFKWPL